MFKQDTAQLKKFHLSFAQVGSCYFTLSRHFEILVNHMTCQVIWYALCVSGY